MRGPAQSAEAPKDELDLFLQLRSHEAARRTWWPRLASVCLHLLALILVVFSPLGRGPVHDVQVVLGQFKEPFTLVAPPPELTQTAPNKGKIGKEFNLESLAPRPKVFAPPAVPPGAPAPGPPVLLPEPPKIEIAQSEMPGAGQGLSGYPLPPLTPQERPKLPVENPAPARAPDAPKPGAPPKITAPNSSISEMGRELARGRGGRTIVEDFSPSPGGFPGGFPVEPTPGRTGSSLELLSDPGGVDFRPYLMRILASVKRNWMSVIPESAKLGRRGRVAIQFIIARDGSVPRLVIASASGADPLDRAAVAGISASNPFPPLPAEYKGQDIRLQFVFLYNVDPTLR
jgi:TonB family protein